MSLLDALEAATPSYEIDDAKAKRLGTAAGAAPGVGLIGAGCGEASADDTPVPSSKKKPASSKKKKRRDWCCSLVTGHGVLVPSEPSRGCRPRNGGR